MRYQMIKPQVPALHRVAFLRNIECTAEEFAEILVWAESEFGAGADISDGYTYKTTRWCYSASSWNLWFKNLDDGMMFKMRWC
jgi:hypothetical protein